MTPEQITEAQRLSREFVPQPQAAKDQPQSPRLQAPRVTDEFPRKVVMEVQRALKAMGYYDGAIDGVVGPKTREAIAAFQREAGLEADGILDREFIGQLDLLGSLASKSGEGPALTSTGTGFVINKDGYAITNHHIIDGCTAIKTPRRPSPIVRETTNGDDKRQSITASVVGFDPASDLAVIDLPGAYEATAQFRDDNKPKLGESVVVAGFPLRGLLADDLNVATGAVSAVSGVGDNPRLLQISAPVQQGNSGGPLLDQGGAVIGVVVAKLNALAVAKETGDIPQNVNFAVKSALARSLLDIHNIPYGTTSSPASLDTADVAAQAQQYTVVVECWK